MADLADIERKTGPIEEGRTLKIMNLNLDEIKILLGSEKVTKNQKKRLLKRQKWIETEPDRKIQKREKRKKARQNRTGPYVRVYDHVLSSDENFNQFLHVGIDFGLNHKMTEDEMKDMAKQSQTCYAAYRRLSTATQLHLLGIKPFIDLYKPFLPGIDNWKIHKEKEIEDFPGKCVYLTAEAEETLDTVETGIIYVIGGIVDRNRMPGICNQRAKEFLIPRKRLPIKEHITYKSRCVLTVPHVYQLLLKVGTGSNWKDALLEVLPKKKLNEGNENKTEDKHEDKHEDNCEDNCKDSPEGNPREKTGEELLEKSPEGS